MATANTSAVAHMPPIMRCSEAINDWAWTRLTAAVTVGPALIRGHVRIVWAMPLEIRRSWDRKRDATSTAPGFHRKIPERLHSFTPTIGWMECCIRGSYLCLEGCRPRLMATGTATPTPWHCSAADVARSLAIGQLQNGMASLWHREPSPCLNIIF